MPFRGEGEDTPDPALRRPLYPGDGRGPETRRDVTLPKSSCFWTLAAQRSLSREAPIRGREVCVKLVVLLTQVSYRLGHSNSSANCWSASLLIDAVH